MSFNTYATTHGTPMRKPTQQELEKKLFARNLVSMQQRFGNNSYAATMAARETAKTTNPQGLAIHDADMRAKRMQKMEEDEQRTSLKAAQEKLRQLRSRSVSE